MSDTRVDTVVCHVCESESPQTIALRAEEHTPPDLDTRPGESLRSTMAYWVQRCPSCGYCAPDLSEGPPRAAKIVRTKAYETLLAEPSRPALANSFLAASVVLESGALFAEAGWQAVYAAWACDDAGALESAVICREQAIGLFDKARQVRQPVVEEAGGTEALLADLWRRCGRFEEALSQVEAGLALTVDTASRRVLEFIALLATQRDTAAHTTREAPATPAAS